MIFSRFRSKVAAHVSRKANKAQGADNDTSLSQGQKKILSGRLMKAKVMFRRRFRKTAEGFDRRTDADASITFCASDFTLSPIELASEDLLNITTETFDNLQRTVIISPASLNRTDNNEASKPSVLPLVSTTIVAAAVTSCASAESLAYIVSVSTENSAGEGSPVHSTSSSETALSVHATAEPPVVDCTKSTAPEVDLLPKAATEQRSTLPALMGNKNTKVRQQKIAEVLHKLKTKFWPWNHTDDSAIELEDDDGILERCQWDIIAKIDRTSIVEIVRRAAVRQGYLDPAVRVVGTAQGTYHYVFKVKTLSPASKKIKGWIVKIPGHGTPDRWTQEDEYMLDQEVTTLGILSAYTNVPSPEVVGHSATLDNEFRFPYIVLEELPGKSATNLWFEEHGEVASPETEQKRLTFLRSLARHMTELKKLPFKQIGLPSYHEATSNYEGNSEETHIDAMPANHYFVWPYCNTFRAVERGPFASTQAYICNARDEAELPSLNKEGKFTYDQLQELGISKVLDLVFAHPVFASTPNDTFTLRHSDLDTQNILIDDSGNITGILDWDGSLSMPRCVGHAAVPHFLERDFYPDAAIKSLFLSWRASHYRSIYAAALVDAGNPDAQYTTKSHIYQAAFAALYEGGDKADFVQRVLREIPGLHMEIKHLMALIGKGCKVTEEMLKTELWKVLDPELPLDGFLQGVEKQHAEAAVQDWMEGFAAFPMML